MRRSDDTRRREAAPHTSKALANTSGGGLFDGRVDFLLHRFFADRVGGMALKAEACMAAKG